MDSDTAAAIFSSPEEMREDSIATILRDQHERPAVIIVKELLQQIRAVLRTHSGAKSFRVSVSSLDPTFANIDLYGKQREVAALLQADLPEILIHTNYEFCWYGGVSGGICCSMRYPRHRLIVNVRLTDQAGTGVS